MLGMRALIEGKTAPARGGMAVVAGGRTQSSCPTDRHHGRLAECAPRCPRRELITRWSCRRSKRSPSVTAKQVQARPAPPVDQVVQAHIAILRHPNSWQTELLAPESVHPSSTIDGARTRHRPAADRARVGVGKTTVAIAVGDRLDSLGSPYLL